jgi:hypothetical protein
MTGLFLTSGLKNVLELADRFQACVTVEELATEFVISASSVIGSDNVSFSEIDGTGAGCTH